MKSFAAFALFGLLAVSAASPFTEDQEKLAQEHIKKCLAVTKADASVVAKMKAADFSNEEEKTQCFTLCFLSEAGFVDANGDLIEDVIIGKLSQSIDKEKVENACQMCKYTKGTTPCNKAFNLFKCFRLQNLF